MVTSTRNGVPPELLKPQEIPAVVIEAKPPEPEPAAEEEPRSPRVQHPHRSHHKR